MPAKQQEMEADSAVYKTLLESTKAIPWRIDWKSMRFSYIGPQIEQLLGWTPESWVSVDDWATRMHPEDRDRVVNFCVSQSRSGVDHEADYRAETRDGGFVWIRDVVHVVRNAETGEVEALVGFMFDISERKRREEEVLRLHRELEALSYRDALTDLANRRMFDQVLEREWSGARRAGTALSLLVIDIDCFKEYNDSSGHLGGDEILKRVATLLCEAASRPRDFVARYGGEEFVVLLPETDAEGARAVAERCRRAVVDARLPHPQSAVSPWLTVSVGVATLVPAEGDDPRRLIDTADRQLYRAKQAGRNAVMG